MGVILTRFRKKRTTLEVLQELDERIQDIKHRRVTAEQRKRVVVGRLMLYSAGLYVLAALWFYFRSFPSTLRDQAFHILPLCVFPVVVVVVRWAVAFYFRRKIVRSEIELKQKEKLKREILEEVMNKETYKSAKEILERFAPADMKTQLAAPGPSPPAKVSPPPPHQGMELRRRPIAPPPAPPVSSPPKPPPSLLRSSPPPAQGQAPERRMLVGGGTGRGLPLPRPIYPRERSVVDKLVDFLIADGPSNRFALICKECSAHNGMALKEEFEFLTFRCCYCFAMNPARKQRPQAPKIEDKKEPSAESSSSEPDTPPTNTSEDEEDAGSKVDVNGGGVDQDEAGDSAEAAAEGEKLTPDCANDEKGDMVGGSRPGTD